MSEPAAPTGAPIIVCEPDEARLQQLLDALEDQTHVRSEEALEDVAGRLDDLVQPTVVVLGPSLPRDDVFRFAEKAEHRPGQVATLLVMADLDAVLLREALRSGIDDVLTADSSRDEWDEALARVSSRLAAEQPTASNGDRRGRIVTTFSTKGGSGKSLVASNVAVLAAQKLGQPVALVDLDLQSGDLAIMFQLMPALTIHDAAAVVDRLDTEALAGYLTMHSSDVALLAAPTEPSLAEQVAPSAVTTILRLLRDMYPLTVIDGPPLFTEQVLAALDETDEIILMGSMDVPSIKNLRLAITTLGQLGHPRDHLRILLNRADSKVGLRTAEVEKSLGVEVDVQLPSSRDVPLSINQGTPLALNRPKSPIVVELSNMVDELLPATTGDTSGTSRRRRR